MSKINAPYNCVYTLNNELLLKTSEIAFQVGRFSVLSAHHSDEENMAKETKALLSFDGISLTPSQFRALGEGGNGDSLVFSLTYWVSFGCSPGV